MHCEIDTKTLVQIAEDAARRVYSEGQQIENTRLRAVARKVCKEILLVEYEKRILEGKDKEEYISHTRAGEPWTECEDRMLKEELATFFTKTAEDHRRSYGAIVSRIKQIRDKEY